jgi:hypothetical protein
MSGGSDRPSDGHRRSVDNTFLTDDLNVSSNPSGGEIHQSSATNTFPAFLFGTPTDHITSVRENPGLADTSDMILDDIFADMDPPISYHNEDFDFLNFLHASGPANNLPSAEHEQSTFQNNPFLNSADPFSPMMVDSHPGIVIPASVSPDVTVQLQPGVSPSRSRRIRPQIQVAQSNQFNLPLSEESIESIPAPLLRQTHVPSLTRKPLELEPWTFDPPLTLSTSRPSNILQAGTTTEISQSSSKASNVPLARRKNSDSPTTESPNSLSKAPKTSHNMIEKRYRLKLNDKILSLRNAVPALRNDMQEDPTTLDSIRALKLNKGTVLTKATEYIKQLEQEKEALETEVANLKQQLAISRGRDFDWGGVAAVNEEKVYTGMISPESCTSEMSPEAEGMLFEQVVEEKVVRSRKRVKVERAY